MKPNFGLLFIFNVYLKGTDIIVGHGHAAFHHDHWHGPVISRFNTCEELPEGDYTLVAVSEHPTIWNDKVYH